MKRFICSALLGGLLLSTAVYAGVIAETDAEIQAIANPLLDNILEGMKLVDYGKWSRDFDAAMKQAIPEVSFPMTNQQIQSQIGSYISREYLGSLKKSNMSMGLWKGVFDGTEDDVLITLVVSKENDKHLVTGLWFK